MAHLSNIPYNNIIMVSQVGHTTLNMAAKIFNELKEQTNKQIIMLYVACTIEHI